MNKTKQLQIMDAELKQQIIYAINANDIELIKKLKEDVSRQKWLEARMERGSVMTGLLEQNPFIAWKDREDKSFT